MSKEMELTQSLRREENGPRSYSTDLKLLKDPKDLKISDRIKTQQIILMIERISDVSAFRSSSTNSEYIR